MLDRLRGMVLRLRERVFRTEADRELDEEMRFHVEMETLAGIRKGLSAEEAKRRALVSFGGVERFKEKARDERGGRVVDDLLRDLRLAVRIMAARPAFSAAAVATLALGIGANTAMFSVVNAVLLRPSPFPDPDRLVMVWETDRSSDTRHEPASWPDVVDFRERSRTLPEMGVLLAADRTLGGDGEPERVATLQVTPELLDVLGVEPLLGRAFTPEEASLEAPFTVMLGEDFWRRRYGSDPSVVGRTITLSEVPATVVGVLPAEADLGVAQIQARADYGPALTGGKAEIWVAIRPTAEAFGRQTHPFLTLGRLAPGLSLAAAQEELAGIAAELEATYQVNAARGVNLEAFGEVVFGPVRPALLVLLGAVALVLLVACANVANLLLARTTSRMREVALRRALGASAGQIRRQFLVESLVLTGLGTAAGMVMAFGGLEALIALAPADIPRLREAGVDLRVLAFTATVGGAVAMVFGLLPTLQVRRVQLQDTLKSQASHRPMADRSGRRFRAALVVGEIALAVTLATGAGLLLKSFETLRQVDPGFDTAGVLKAQYRLPGVRYPLDFSRWPDLSEINGFHTAFVERVRALPGVRSAALASHDPLDAGFTNSFAIVGREAESAEYPEIRTRFVTPGYLETVDLEVLEGRGPTPADIAGQPPVGVINRTGARRYFPDGNAVGQVVRFWGIGWRLVGIVEDERFRGLASPPEPAVYVPLAQAPQQAVTLLVRTHGDPAALAPAVRRALRAVDPQIALFEVEPLSATLSASVAEPRFTAVLLGVFAGLAILLALIGVHGVLAYTVAERSAETGIRLALGASRGHVIRSIVGEGMMLAALGVAIGLAVALAGSGLVASLVFQVAPRDPATFAGVALLVLAVASMTSLLPAIKAVRADPVASLRAE